MSDEALRCHLLDDTNWTFEDTQLAIERGWAEYLWVRLEDGREEMRWVYFRYPGYNGRAALPYDWVCSQCGDCSYGFHACQAFLDFGDPEPDA